jgi:hypothetical protein
MGSSKKSQPRPKNIIFRRYRRGRNGETLDAHDYGIKAWPINLNDRTER